jgi:hypothetical protein
MANPNYAYQQPTQNMNPVEVNKSSSTKYIIIFVILFVLCICTFATIGGGIYAYNNTDFFSKRNNEEGEDKEDVEKDVDEKEDDSNKKKNSARYDEICNEKYLESLDFTAEDIIEKIEEINEICGEGLDDSAYIDIDEQIIDLRKEMQDKYSSLTTSGTKVVSGNLEYTLLEIYDFGTELKSDFGVEDGFYDKDCSPEKGNRYFAVEFEVKNNTDKIVPIKILTLLDKNLEPIYSNSRPMCPRLKSDDGNFVNPGEKRKIGYMFEVPDKQYDKLMFELYDFSKIPAFGVMLGEGQFQKDLEEFMKKYENVENIDLIEELGYVYIAAEKNFKNPKPRPV